MRAKTITKTKDNRDVELKLDNGVFGKWSFVNKNYQMLQASEKMAKTERFVTAKLFSKQKLAMFGLILFVVIAIASIIIPYTAQDPKFIDTSNNHLPVFSTGHIFGTDYLGRDTWARVWSGIRFSLGMAAIAVLVDVIIGYTFGLLMGYFPLFDKIGQFVIKILINVPSTIILILLTLVLKPTFWTIILGITITGWIGMANQVRGQVLRMKQGDWVVASRTLGSPWYKIVFKKMGPHLIPIIVAQLIFTIPAALVGDLSLSVFGLSIPNTATLGSIMDAGRKFILIYPMEAFIPVLTASIILVSIQFIGLGMQKSVNRGV